MAGLQPAFPVIFVAALCIIAGAAAFIFVSNRRDRENFSAFARLHGFTYSARPSEEAADLLSVVRANIVAITGESSTRRTKLSHLVAGSWMGREFRSFCCASIRMSMTRGTVLARSTGAGFSRIERRAASTTCCLQVRLRASRGMPDLWVKKHTPRDSAYRLTGLREVEPQDPEWKRTYRVFCLDPHVTAPSLPNELLTCLERLDPSEVLQIHDDYLLLTSRAARGTAWIEEKLDLLSRVCDLIEQ